jgi:hypothetical protein
MNQFKAVCPDFAPSEVMVHLFQFPGCWRSFLQEQFFQLTHLGKDYNKEKNFWLRKIQLNHYHWVYSFGEKAINFV